MPKTDDTLPTLRITDAVANMFIERGDACLREFTLRTGRRVDIIAIGNGGEITIVEVKSSRQDFLSDRKWHEYPEWADRFYFAVADTFPREILPDSDMCGVIITDGFDCLEIQPAPESRLAAQRRNHLVKRIAHIAMRRLEFTGTGATLAPDEDTDIER
ncbi:MmcB family DNA repair protein [Alphaproteobacteria bacterium LSUCC0719]